MVRSLDQLLTLPGDRRVNGFGLRTLVQLAIAGLSAGDRMRAERALNRFQSRCGCVAAGLTSSGVIVAGSAYVSRHVAKLLSWPSVRQLLVVLALGIVAGMIAKLITLAVTRVQFSRECRTQYEWLSGRSA